MGSVTRVLRLLHCICQEEHFEEERGRQADVHELTASSLDEFAFFNVVEKLNACLVQEPYFLAALEPQIKWFTFQFTDFQNVLRDADTDSKRARVAGPLKALKEAAIDAKSVIDNFIVKTAHQKPTSSFTKSFFYFHDWIARQEATSKLQSIKVDMEKLNMIRTVLDNEESPSPHSPFPLAPMSFTYYGSPEYNIVGREEDIKAIQEHLLSKDMRLLTISLVGMQGTGKTTIARKICKKFNIKSHFGFIAWVSSGDSQSSVEILKNARDETWKTSSHMKRKMEEALRDGEDNSRAEIFDLLRNKRYLVVIDGTTAPEAMDNVKALLSDTLSGSRILLTTRDARIATHTIHSYAGEPPPYHIGPLSPENSWKLLTMKARELFATKVGMTTPSPELVLIGKKIVKKCHGLPLAIKHLAHDMSQKEISTEGWLKVLKSYENDQTVWSYILCMIIRDLPLNLKRCLFYFGFFPQNSKIPVRRLIALWVAEGFIEPKNDKTLEYVAEEYLSELINLHMIRVSKWRSNGKPKKCCLANYLHEHLLAIAKQFNYVTSTSRTTTGVRRLVDHPGPEDNKGIASPDSYRLLLSFVSFDHRESYAPGEKIRNFLHGGINKGCFQLLRVLDLERVYKPVLPKELGRLLHLRYLGLRWTYLDALPSSVGKLINLQTLDLKHTYVNTLPKSIWKLQKLRHLYLNESHLANFVHHPSAGYLENLQILWGIFIDEESPMEEGLDRFIKLTRLGVSCHLTSKPKQDAMANWISKLHHLESLRVISKDRLSKLQDIMLTPFTNHKQLHDLYLLGQFRMKLFEVNEFPPKLTELTLSASKLEEDPLPTLERLPNLRILRLYSASYIGERMDCSSSGFRRLQVLEIWNLEELEEWEVEEGAMPILKILEIRYCENLKMLPAGLQQITTIQQLKLTDMPKLFTDIVKKDKNKDWYKKAGVRCVFLNVNQQRPTKQARHKVNKKLEIRILSKKHQANKLKQKDIKLSQSNITKQASRRVTFRYT